jgi:uncharacterized RDD family membrane protein YckC
MESGEYFIPITEGRARRREDDLLSQASFSTRCAALLFDYILTLLVPALALVLAVFIKRRWQSPLSADIVVVAGYSLTAVLILFNFFYFYVLDGQSFGKRLIGIRLVRADGGNVGWKTVLVRHLIGYPLSLLPFGLGFIWALWDSKHQGWHDKIANTIVIND